MPSSVINAFSYDTITATLRILFVSGIVYDYRDVPEHVYRDMKNNFSKGKFFNKYIKGRYEFRKVG